MPGSSRLLLSPIIQDFSTFWGNENARTAANFIFLFTAVLITYFFALVLILNFAAVN